MRPRVAVLLAAYNGIRWLPEQLASILGQEDVDVTVFVSIDHSTDGTESWLRAQAAADHRLVVLPPGRFGGAAPNFYRLLRDVDFRGFDFVSLADQDDVWFRYKLARAISCLDRHQASGYSGNVIAFWPDGRQQLVDKAQPQVAADFVFEAAGPGCTYVLRAALVDAFKALLLSRPDECHQVFLHDWLIYAFARAQGFHWVIDSEPHLRYRQHGHNQVGVNTGLRALLRRFRLVGSGWAFEQAALVARLVGADRIPYIANWLNRGRNGLLKLSFKARQCRRRPRDQVLFFLSCWLRALNPGASSRKGA